jgi:isopenicillin N synthase-like dioxygenase
MRIYTPPKPAALVPVIDLQADASFGHIDRKTIGWEIHKACRETGFFYVSNHGVPKSLIDDQFRWTRSFFDLPLDDKLALHMKHSPSRAGYEPVGGQVLDSQDGSEKAPPDLKESFYIGVELPADKLIGEPMRGYGYNQWPDNLSGFRQQMLAYQSALHVLADQVLSLIAVSLDVPDGYFEPFFDSPITTVRLIKYPPQPAGARFNQIGAGAHTDWGGITILAQDSLGGLEVQNVEGDWIEAPPVPGTFVVNLGDLMARWTNGLYQSNFHRVRNNNSEGQARYSIPFFYNPRRDALIECIPTCVAADQSPKYPAITAAQHLDEMFQRSYGYA